MAVAVDGGFVHSAFIVVFNAPKLYVYGVLKATRAGFIHRIRIGSWFGVASVRFVHVECILFLFVIEKELLFSDVYVTLLFFVWFLGA